MEIAKLFNVSEEIDNKWLKIFLGDPDSKSQYRLISQISDLFLKASRIKNI